MTCTARHPYRLFRSRLLRRFMTVALSGVALAGVSNIAQAQVVGDGGTATSVTIDGAGVSNVLIAPPNPSGISHNTYREFSVPSAGVNLDNREAVARTILNEVTSSRISNLNGPLEVLGARAHVILANPNGIVVDGGRFINTGGVVLSTGKASIVSRPVVTGTQDNVVLETSRGRIDVTGAGLSGAMTTLQMLAGEIRIDGPVEMREEGVANARSTLEMFAGGSRVEFDSDVMPGSTLDNWRREFTPNGSPDGGLAVEITKRGSLKANTIRILATDQGAGVSHAGQGVASMGDFRIDASGKVLISGQIKAAQNVRVAAGSIETRSIAGEAQSSVEAVNGALTMLAATGDIVNAGALLQGAKRDNTDGASKGGATLQAAGDIRLITENPDQLAIVFSSEDDLSVSADDNVENNTGRLLSNGVTRIEAGGDVINSIDIVPGATPVGEWTYEDAEGKRLWYTLWQSRKHTTTMSVDYGRTRIGNQLAYIVGQNLVINAGGGVFNRGGSIMANGDDNGDGGLVVINAATISNESVAAGALQFTKTCGLTCVGYGSSDITLVGGHISGYGDVSLVANQAMFNSGQITTYGDLNLVAPEVTIEGTRTAAVYTRPPGLYNFWRGSTAWIGEIDQGGVIIAPQGSVSIDAFKPVTVNAGVIEGRYGVFATNGIDVVAPPENGKTLSYGQIGLLRELVGE